MKELLGPSDDKIIPGYRETIKTELDDYIEATGRLTPVQVPSTLNP